MIAMVLAAGLGTRMRPLTLLRAKPALPVLNRPLLHWTLASLRRAGVTDVVINTHHRPASVRAAARAAARALGMRLRFSHERTLLGSIGGVRKARRWLGSGPFLLLNGDMVFDFELRPLIAKGRGAAAAVSLQRHPRRGRYGSVVTDARGRVLSFAGQPRPARGAAWHFTGIQVLDPRLLERLGDGYAETARDLYGPLLAAGERVEGVLLEGPWHDLSSPALYLASQLALLRRGFAQTRRGLCVHRDARVDAGARLRRAVVGPGCVIGSGAVVEDSVLWRGVRVGASARVSGSILTDGVRVAAGETLRSRLALRRRPRGAAGGRLRRGRYELELAA